MTAERLRQAAERLRDLVEADGLPKCAWVVSDRWSDDVVTTVHDDSIWIVGASIDGGGALNRSVADFVATMSPPVALAVAAWLDGVAATEEAGEPTITAWSEALAVADAVMGES